MYIFLSDKKKIPFWRNFVTCRTPCSTQKTSNRKKTFFCFHNIRMLDLTLNELKLAAKNRSIKDYESKSENDLINIFSEPKTSLSKKKIRGIRKDFNK